MKYWTAMKYKKATNQEIDAYYETHPEHRRMVIQDWNDHEDTDLEWGRFDDITEFVIVPEVGIIPTYVEDSIRDHLRTPTWESMIYEVYQFRIFKILWFVTFFREEYNEIELNIYPLEKYDEVLHEAELLASQHEEDVYGYWFEWNSKVFSNNKKFIAIIELPDVAIDDLEEIETLAAPGYDYPENLRASILNTEDGHHYVGVNYMGSISLMAVDSEDEARQIMTEIWQ